MTAIQTGLPGVRIQTIPRGGIHLWAWLPQGADTRETSTAPYAAEVLVRDTQHFSVDEALAPFLRFSYGAAAPQNAGAVRRLAGILADILTCTY